MLQEWRMSVAPIFLESQKGLPNITIDLTPASRCSAAAGHRERSADKVTHTENAR
jgi:hypothetical protein